MFQSTFNSQTVYVVDDFWNGQSPLRMEIAIIRDAQVSLTKRESRRPFSATLRVQKLQYAAVVHDAALRRLQGSLRAITTEPVVVPLWPAITRWMDRATAPISGGLKIVWKEDWSQFELFTDTEPEWPSDDDNFAPALFGFLKPAEPDVSNPDAVEWRVEFVESSPAAYSLQPSAFSFPGGPQPPGYSFAPPLLPVIPDFNAVSEEISVEVKREQLGFTRQQAQTFYPHAASRSQKADYTLTATQAGQFLRFFQDIAAPGAVFWASGWMQLARLTQDALATDSVLHVEDTGAVNVGDYVSIYNSSGALARKVVGRTANTIQLDDPVGNASPANDTCIFPLCLARLDKSIISLSWNSPESVSLSLSWTEVPAELLPANDEIIGSTLGKLPQRVVLFKFSRDLRNGTVLEYHFTNYERDILWDGHTWASRNIQCGDISRGLNLEDDGCDIMAEKFPGNPLIDDLTKTAEAPLSVTIHFADFDGASVSNATTEFTGSVGYPGRDGNRIKVKCKFGPAVLDNLLPFFITGPVCNYLKGNNADGTYLISPGCTLLAEDWKFTGLMTAPVTAGFPFTINLATLTGDGSRAAAALASGAVFANWFANGWCEWGTGAAIQRRGIIGSSAIAAGVLSLMMHRFFRGLPNIGDTITFYPGCDGLYRTCKAYDAANNPSGKFGNNGNFGAEPLMPIGNPTFVGQPSIGVSGSKK
jgi:hypothetical protein